MIIIPDRIANIIVLWKKCTERGRASGNTGLLAEGPGAVNIQLTSVNASGSFRPAAEPPQMTFDDFQ
jgi:hypothetical protein